MRLLRIATIFVAAALAAAALPAPAQEFPTRAIRIIVARPPGGASDLIARAISVTLAEKWGQPIVVENLPGANGVIASNLVARSPKDGYTWLLADDAHPVNPHLQKSMPYDAMKDLQPVALLATQPMLMVINPNVPAKTLQEFVALAKAAPGKYAYSSAGIGSAQHLAALGIANAAGIELLHVPYKSGAIMGAMSGDVAVFVGSAASVLPLVETNRVRPLAITSPKRFNMLPQVPTVREAGYAFEFFAWEGVMVASGTPAPIVARIQAALVEAMKAPETQKQLGDKMTLVGSTSEEFAQLIATDYARWGKALKEAGVVPE